MSLGSLPALAQEERRTVQVQIPGAAHRELGSRLLTIETPSTLAPGMGMVEGLVWTNPVAGSGSALQNLVTGTGLTAIVDYGVADRTGIQVQAGLSGQGLGPIAVMGKYAFLSEGVDRAPLSVGAYARLHGNLPGIADLVTLNFGTASAGLTVGVPLSRTITDRLTVMAVPGLSLLATTRGMATTGNLGLAADFAISPGLRGILETRLGALPAGSSPISAGLRYDFTSSLMADVFFGLGAMTPASGLGFGLALPSLGIGGYYKF
jgi:hypothetical protein